MNRLTWSVEGFGKVLSGDALPYGIGDWYWNPSRAIPAPNDVEPITEFPFFTVLYGDPHAHLFAIPIALLALAWIVGVLLGKGKWKNFLAAACSFFIGALAIGALQPTNTFDMYTYLPLAVVVIAYTFLCYFEISPRSLQRWTFLKGVPTWLYRCVAAVLAILALLVLSRLLYQPFRDWFTLGYTRVDLWEGTRTPLVAYLTHWGLFLFVIVSWMVWETYHWMASTPLASVRKLEPYRGLIFLGALIVLLTMFAIIALGGKIAWLVYPLAAWAGVLLLRPGTSDEKRFVLFLVGTGLVLTTVVEVVVFRGDVGRMNTVFKIYLQVWTFFAIAAATGLGWIIPSLSRWKAGWRTAWEIALAALVFGAALYPLMGSMAKIKDRMAPDAPHTLDGMAFMNYATYDERWGKMDLSQDYRAIRWLQENVKGSPVIVEANLRDLYRWGSRMSIYTGLPGVVGWEWHQQQQRAALPGTWVSDRIAEIDDFYQTMDISRARDFLKKYDVRYIILGQQERGHYYTPDNSQGLDKFAAFNGVYWREVYRDGDTVIYEVIEPPAGSS